MQKRNAPERPRAAYTLSSLDLEVVLAITRAGTLAASGERLGLDASTVFRHLQRIERGLGQALFDRGRGGYVAKDMAQGLAEQAEVMESALEAARSQVQAQPADVAGTVRLSTTDTVLHALVAPALRDLQRAHPLLQYELHTGNELANLSRRDTDIAVRATRRPPAHLVGRQLGTIRVAVYAARQARVKAASLPELVASGRPWIAPDDALPDHPSVVWRRRHFPKLVPQYRVNSIQSVLELTALGLGVGVLPVFLAQGRRDLVALSEPLHECDTELWLLTHPASRHLRRVALVFGHLAQSLRLPAA